jgi:hypothetical protein
LNIVHFSDIQFEQYSNNSEVTPMQTVLSEIALSFADDAITLATGFKRIAAELAVDLVAAARARIMAPIDRLAQACDVAGTLSARNRVQARAQGRVKRPATCAHRHRSPRFDVFRIRAALRTLRDLT